MTLDEKEMHGQSGQFATSDNRRYLITGELRSWDWDVLRMTDALEAFSTRPFLG
jgi:hypothetical protein